MALTSVKLESIQHGTDTSGKESTTAIYLCQYDTFDVQNAYDAKTADDGTTSIPGIGDLLNGSSSTRCSRITSQAREDFYKVIVVTCTYEEKSASAFSTNPLTKATLYAWNSAEDSEVWFWDYSTPPKPFAASNGVNFSDNPNERPIPLTSVTITKNLATKPFAYKSAYLKTINENAITIDGQSIPARHAFCDAINFGTEQVQNGVSYFPITYVINIRWDSFDYTIPDRGYAELNVDGELVPILNADGTPVDTTYPLNGSGSAKANADDEPATLTFKRLKEVDWTGFDLT